MKSNVEKGGLLTDSLLTLHLVHFLIKFSTTSALKNLTIKCNFLSSLPKFELNKASRVQFIKEAVKVSWVQGWVYIGTDSERWPLFSILHFVSSPGPSSYNQQRTTTLFKRFLLRSGENYFTENNPLNYAHTIGHILIFINISINKHHITLCQ